MRIFAVVATVITVAMALGAALAAGADLRPRAAGGWEGFRPGTWVKLQVIFYQEDRRVVVSIQTTRLVKVGDKDLSLERINKNALGMEQTIPFKMPRTGEAGEGERETGTQNLPDSTYRLGEAELACTARAITVTTKTGKRVITYWESVDPPMLVRKKTEHFDASGKRVQLEEVTLEAVGEQVAIKGRSIACNRYKTESSHGNQKNTGSVLMSRNVPGGIVRVEQDKFIDGKKHSSHKQQVTEFVVRRQ